MWKFNIDRLIALRQLQGLSQEEFAARLGTRKQHVSQWETGELIPSTKTLVKIATIFNLAVGPAYFFVRDNKDSHYDQGINHVKHTV